jgi:hypothetical protein
MNFVMWTFVYSLPLWIAAVGLGYFAWKKRAR